MVYPGNSELSADAQERVMTAFRQVVTKLQEGQREEALIGLEFVLRLDPRFAPAVNLQRQLSSGAAEIDLSEIIAQLHAPTTDMINEILVEAVDDFNQRNFLDAKEKVERVLLELPGHHEARQLLVQIQDALKVETQVGQFLTQAREALDRGDPQEAANFVMMAQALDPHHQGISATLQEIQAASGIVPQPLVAAEKPVEVVDDFGVSFEAIDEGAPAFGEPAPSPTPPGAAPPASPFSAAASDFSFAIEEPPSATPSFAAAPPPKVGTREDFFGGEGPPLDTAEGLGEAVSGEQGWSAEALGEFSFGPDEGVPVTPAAAAPRDDISDLFEAESAEWSGAVPAAAAEDARPEDAERIKQLLQQGAAAFDRGDYQEAIDVWSRIYLLDPASEEAARRIDEAHQRKDEVDRRVEHVLFEAQDAALSGDVDRALELVDQILALAPTHVEAVELKERLTAPGAPASEPAATAASAPPDLDEDLFRETGPEAAVASGAAVAEAVAPLPAARRRALPWLPIALGVGGLVVILLGVWFGGQLLSPRSTADEDAATVNRVLAQGEALYGQGRVDEAIHLYQELLRGIPASNLERQRIEHRLAELQRASAPPTPTAIPESFTAAEDFFQQGRLLSAYGRVVQGLQKQPQDLQLAALRDRILQQQPLIGPLYAAAQKGDFQTAVAISEDLLRRDPKQPEVASELGRYLFDAAVLELWAYNLTAAEGYLQRLSQLQPGDEEATRVLRFTEKYKTRPADLQLNTFIKSLSPR